MDDSAWNAINSMKSDFTPKWGKNFGRKKESTKQCQEYDEIFVQLYHFTERYLDKLRDV